MVFTYTIVTIEGRVCLIKLFGVLKKHLFEHFAKELKKIAAKIRLF